MRKMKIQDLFSEFYIVEIPEKVEKYYNPIRLIANLLEEKFINLDWLRQFLLETKMLNYKFNQVLWILSGIEMRESKANNFKYLNYRLRSKLAFQISYRSIMINEIPIIVNNEKIMEYKYKRGNNILILPKTVFNLDYMHVNLSSPGKDEHFNSRGKKDSIPDPIVQIPNNLNARTIILDLYFLEELPEIWGSNKIEYIDITAGKYLNLGDRFSELPGLKTLKLKNLNYFPSSIYECHKIKHLSINGKVKCEKNKIVEMKSLTNYELFTSVIIDDKDMLEKELTHRNIDYRIIGPSEIEFE